MKILYDNLNIEFNIDNFSFSTLNIALEQFLTPVPKHSHGDKNFELHYVTRGYGIVMVDHVAYELSPNTLYVTGPHVEHEQVPFPSDPMVEYSIFFSIKKRSSKSQLFTSLTAPPLGTFVLFWAGLLKIADFIRKYFFGIQNTEHRISDFSQCFAAAMCHYGNTLSAERPFESKYNC